MKNNTQKPSGKIDQTAETDRIEKPYPEPITRENASAWRARAITAEAELARLKGAAVESVDVAVTHKRLPEGNWQSCGLIPPVLDVDLLGWDERRHCQVIVRWHRNLGTTGGFGEIFHHEIYGYSLKFNPFIILWRELP